MSEYPAASGQTSCTETGLALVVAVSRVNTLMFARPRRKQLRPEVAPSNTCPGVARTSRPMLPSQVVPTMGSSCALPHV